MKHIIWFGACALMAIACGDDDDDPECGDGVQEGTEQCDDGNTMSNDGCSATCQTEQTASTACKTYCDAVMTNCADDNAIYADRASCEAACEAMPEGNESDQSGNSVYCRAYHAGDPAAGDPATHCPHASASSDSDVCGTKCEAYCDQVMANCSGDNSIYADRASCEAACAAMPAGAWDDTGGNSASCRTYHASFPAAGDPATHCPHAGISSDSDICGTRCEAYCDQAMANCSGDNAIYADRASCEAACAAMPAGAWDDTGGNSASCRTYHASFPAAGDPATHCPHAGISSDSDLCGTKCEAYCDQAMANCMGENALYPDRASCEAACAAMPAGAWDDTGGNSASCRTYHASFPAAGDPATHCPHAGLSSDSGICGTSCDAYCDQAMANCMGENTIYPDRASCEAACAAMPAGAWNDRGGNSASCRAYHASFPAAGDAATHCPHAGISSDSGICGTPCDAYCDQAMANCMGANELYSDRSACEAACSGFPTGTWNDTGADSAHCRAYHASFPAAGDPATHCPHAGVSGDGVCVDPV